VTTIHLHPTAELAERVLLPGDPGRALLLAQELLEAPRMFNHHRGLWGYTGGATADGAPLTIQSTGMGGPSAAIVIEELVQLGARRFVRVGTCGALAPELELGDAIVVSEAIATDGTSRALGAVGGGRVAPDAGLTAALANAAVEHGGAHRGAVVSTDLFYGAPPPPAAAGAGGDALAVELESATLFRLAQLRGVRAGTLLIVSDLVVASRSASAEGEHDGPPPRLDDEELATAARRTGRLAAAALSD
jgi:DeoD family purine-nucleoside phosphorylase